MNATNDEGVTGYGPGDVLPSGRIVGQLLPDGLGGYQANLIAHGQVHVTIAQAKVAAFWGWETISNPDASGLVVVERKEKK